MHFLLYGLNPIAVSAIEKEMAARSHMLVYSESVRETLEYIEVSAVDAAILNVDEELGAAIGMARLLRLNATQTRLVLMCSSESTETVVRWLKTVDDVIRGPLDPHELAARIIAIPRPRNADKTIVVGGLSLDVLTGTISAKGEVLPLTRSEATVLRCLLRQPGVVVPKALIAEVLYGKCHDDATLTHKDGRPDKKNVDVYVCKLRRKLLKSGVGDIIETVWGRGFVVKKPGLAYASPSVRKAASYVATSADVAAAM